MNFYYLTFIFFLLITNICAQEQQGLVREQNSNKKPVPEVQIIFQDAIPTISDDNGKFRLVFSGKQEGDLIFYNEISKRGYEIVNEKELQILKIATSGKLSKDIILAKDGILDAARKQYYDISDEALANSFNEEAKKLKTQLLNAQIKNREYQERFSSLWEEYERQQKSLDELANLFARVNFDDVSESYKKAFDLYKEAKIDDAIKILEDINLLDRAKKRFRERKRLELAEQVINEQHLKNEDEIRQDIEGIQLQAELYKLTFQFDKAEKLFDRLYQLDSTDYGILSAAGNFYFRQHRYQKAIKLCNKIISHPETRENQKGVAYYFLGDVYESIGNLPEALMAYTHAYEIYTLMEMRTPQAAFPKKMVATLSRTIGNANIVFENYDEGIKYLKRGQELAKKLVEENPDSKDFKLELGKSYQALGIGYNRTGDFKKDWDYFKKAVVIAEELHEKYPQDKAVTVSLLKAYYSIGQVYKSAYAYDEAIANYDKSLIIAEEIFNSNPLDISSKNQLSTIYTTLGLLHTLNDDVDKALKYLEKSLAFKKELLSSYPGNVSFKEELAIAHEKLRVAYLDTYDYEQALEHLESEIILREQLYTAFPERIQFKERLAVIYYKASAIYSKKIHEDKIALKYLNKALPLLEELVIHDPRYQKPRDNSISAIKKITALLNRGQQEETPEDFAVQLIDCIKNNDIDCALQYFTTKEELVDIFQQYYDDEDDKAELIQGLEDNYPFLLERIKRDLKDICNGIIDDNKEISDWSKVHIKEVITSDFTEDDGIYSGTLMIYLEYESQIYRLKFTRFINTDRGWLSFKYPFFDK